MSSGDSSGAEGSAPRLSNEVPPSNSFRAYDCAVETSRLSVVELSPDPLESNVEIPETGRFCGEEGCNRRVC